MRPLSSSALAALTLSVVATACSGNGSEAEAGRGGTSSAGGNINLAGTTSSSRGGNGSAPVLTPNDTCATGTASAVLSSVNMFVMFDRSSSMNDRPSPNGESRWQMASRALDAFFADPNAAGLSLALRFFPHDEPAAGCSQDGCNVTACATPLVRSAPSPPTPHRPTPKKRRCSAPRALRARAWPGKARPSRPRSVARCNGPRLSA